jgi:uncharacterized protein with HEPN domain
MRHRLIHGYADIDLDYVWMVLCDDLAPLATSERLVPREDRYAGRMNSRTFTSWQSVTVED